VGEVLVVDDQLDAEAFLQAALHQRVQGRQHPGGQAVRVDGDGQALVAVERGAQLARGVGPQGLHLAGIAQQHLARLGQAQRPLAHHQHMADIAFQRAQALRHRRLGDVQQLGGTVEAAGLGQGGQAFQAGGVQGIHGTDVFIETSVSLMLFGTARARWAQKPRRSGVSGKPARPGRNYFLPLPFLSSAAGAAPAISSSFGSVTVTTTGSLVPCLTSLEPAGSTSSDGAGSCP
jgi:hypothetical protein